MHGSVPLARRNTFAEPRRLAAGGAIVGLAIMLILLLDGLWTGITRSVTAYQDHAGADLYVAQPNTRNFLGAVSRISRSTVDQVRADPDVEWASPVRTFLAIVGLHDTKVPVSIIGWDIGEHGGPWEITDGREPQSDDEVAIGRVMADRHGLDVGDSLDLMGREFRVVGTSTDTYMLAFVFMTHTATDALLGSPDTTSFVLVSTDRPDNVRATLSRTGLAVLDQAQLAANDRALMTRAYEVPLRVMRGVAFGIGIVVIALSVYTEMMDRRREYGIVAAMGATRAHLASLALRQTLIVATAGLTAGGILFLAGRAVITTIRPQFDIVLTATIAGRAVATAIVMALLASLLPAHRLARLEPAIAYRGG